MLLQRPSAHLMSRPKTTVQQPSKPMTADISGNWIYPIGTVSTLTGFSTEKSSTGWSWTCEHTERLSQPPGQQRSYHGRCWRRVRSLISVPRASGSVWTVGLVILENICSNKVEEKVLNPIRNLADKSKRKTCSSFMFNEDLLSKQNKKKPQNKNNPKPNHPPKQPKKQV